jgi:tetratricopeptide (TPR) repeat protein
MRNCREGLLPGTEEWHWTQLVDIELKLELDPEAAERETNEIKLEGIGRFHVLLARATALSRLGRLGDAVKALQAAAVVPGIGAAYGGRLKVQLGQVYEQAGRYEDGLGMYQAALRVALSSKDTALEAEALLALGQSLRNRADYTEAAKYLRESLRLAQTMGDRVIEARALAQLAVVQNVMGERQSAEASILRALRVAREAGSTRTEAAVLNLTGNVYFEQGRVAEALKACEEARDAARNCGARRTEIAAESNIAALNIELGQEAGAMEALEKAYRMARELKEMGLALTILSNIGELHAIRWKSGGEEREYKSAVDALRKATEERRKIGMAPLFTAEQMLAELLFDAGETVAAREFAQKALDSAGGRGDRLATDVAARARKILDGLQVPAPPAAAPSPVSLGRAKGKRPKGKRPRSPAPVPKSPGPAAKPSGAKGPIPLKPRPRKRR